MEIAIAGMEYVGDAQIKLLADLGDALHYLRQFAARHDAVLHVIIRCQSAHGAKGAFAPLPKKLAFGLIFGDSDLARAATRANIAHELHRTLRMFDQALDFDDQYRFSVAGKTNRRAGLDGFDGRSVYHLQRCRNDSRPGDIDDGLGRPVHLIKNCQQRADGFSGPHKSDDGFGNDSHRPFGADEYAAKIVAGRVRHFTAEPKDLPIIEHHFDAENVIRRYAIGKRVRATGIICHVAADGTGCLAARVRRVKEAVFRDGFRNIDIDDAWFDNGDAVLQINFQNTIKPSKRQNNPAFCGHGAAGKTGARTARHDRNIGLLGKLNHRGHFFRVSREHNNLRYNLKDRAVLFIDDDVLFLDKNVAIADGST